ncbi:HAD-IIA family hydrolase [Nocardia sp. BMG51109]|uniref:HAD-IIA family hydrolase n=1 Tax=Nocardia sp. BMG51109 TaxID=1056816 RepID=UPI00046411F1|nr:HAD-IIA family hydrolase [Nocardia sp. BMG51109]
MAGIRGVLYDIDGVLVTSWRAVPGAADAVRAVHEAGLRRAFLTNTTSASCAEIAERLCAAGIPVDISEIVTAARLTVEYLSRHHPGARVWVLNHGAIEDDLTGLTLDAEHPDVIVIGGAGAEFTHRALSRVVESMLDGIPVIAMQGSMTWATADGLRIDTGTYLPGLEAAGHARITVIGKPSPTGFHACAGLLGLRPEQLLMIGDDLHSDVLAARAAGMTGVLVRTGKFRQSVLDAAASAPDHVLDSVAELPALVPAVALPDTGD